MKKLFLILGIVFSVIAIAFTTTLIISSVKCNYAENHYEVTYQHSSGGLSSLISGYGCGDLECKFCNGREKADSYEAFVYYQTMSSLKTSSIVILCVSGGLTIAFFSLYCLYRAGVLKKKIRNNI